MKSGMNYLDFVASLIGSLAWPVATFCIACLFRSQIRALLARLNEVALGNAKATFANELDQAEQQAAAIPTLAEDASVERREVETLEYNSNINDSSADQIHENLGSKCIMNDGDLDEVDHDAIQSILDDGELDEADHDAIALAYTRSSLKRYQPYGAESGRFSKLLDISPNAAILDTYRVFERILFRSARRLLRDFPERSYSASSIRKELVREGHIGPGVETLMAQLQDLRNKAAHGADATIPDAIRFRDLANKVGTMLWRSTNIERP